MTKPSTNIVMLAAMTTSLFEMYDFQVHFLFSFLRRICHLYCVNIFIQVYGYLASFIGDSFFPANADSSVGLIEAFGTYSAAFLMRPLGGLYFGRIGDRVGRRSALIKSTLLMALPSLLIGVLPSYSRIGVWATLALVACRMAQGFALGGQLTGSYLVLVESAPPGRRGFYGAFSSAGDLTPLLPLPSLSTSLSTSLSL